MNKIQRSFHSSVASEKKENTDRWVNFAGAAVAVLSSVLISKVVDLAWSPQNVIMACSLFVALMSIIVGIGDLLTGESPDLQTQRLLADLEGLVPRRSRPTWLFSEEELRRTELSSNVGVMWIITPDFENDMSSGAFRDAVNANLARGVRYVYLYPQNDRNSYRRRSLNFTAEQLKRITFKPIAPDRFRLLAVTEIAIYNPTQEVGRDQIRALLELPVEGTPYWIQLEDQAAEDVASRFASFVDASAEPARFG